MFKVYNNIAPRYLQELFHTRDTCINMNNAISNLGSVTRND